MGFLGLLIMVYLLIGASGIFHALLRVWEILEFDFLEFGPTVSYLSSFFGGTTG